MSESIFIDVHGFISQTQRTARYCPFKEGAFKAFKVAVFDRDQAPVSMLIHKLEAVSC